MCAHRPSFQHKKSFLKSYDGGMGSSGIVSPAVSAGGSTTVTPITPMTPLTTPRTPLQILLGRQGIVVGGPYRRSSISQVQNSTLSDEEEDQYREKQLLALRLFANFLNSAESMLNDIFERESSGQQVLGPGIVRVCHDLADEIEGVARQLNKEHMQAATRFERVDSNHELALIEEGRAVVEETKNQDLSSACERVLLSAMNNNDSTHSVHSHEDFMVTLSTTHTLLLDMAVSLRAVTQQEAQELGEVALEVARMFVWSLGMVHGNMIQMTVSNEDQNLQLKTLPSEEGNSQESDEPMRKASAGGHAKQHRVTWSNDNPESARTGRELGPVVEILGEEEKKDEHPLSQPGTPTRNGSSLPKYDPQLSPIPSSPRELQAPTPTRRHVRERVRLLWPPLLPTVTGASKQCVNSAKDHPISAIAISFTCGPAAIAAAAIAGPPLLVADLAIQHSYNALSEHTPVIENMEKGAANALQVSRLAILCSKILVKQGMSVGERQIERRGGVGKVCSDVVGGAVDMALHPVETVGMAWDGLWWMGGAVRDAAGFVAEAVNGGDLNIEMH
ncbi:hypothetical protein ACHAWF_017011 [Thalassiosira exigua]